MSYHHIAAIGNRGEITLPIPSADETVPPNFGGLPRFIFTPRTSTGIIIDTPKTFGIVTTSEIFLSEELPGKGTIVCIHSTSAAPQGDFSMPANVEFLEEAMPVSSRKILLRFADGLSGTVNLSQHGIDTTQLDISTCRASEWGSSAEIDTIGGETYDIDSAVLRAWIDPVYSAALEASIKSLGF